MRQKGSAVATKKKFNSKTFEMPETLPVRLYDLSFNDAIELDEQFGLGVDDLFGEDISTTKRAMACVFIYMTQNFTGVTKEDVTGLPVMQAMSRIQIIVEDPDPKG
jgi:hypothetical protein